MTKTDNLTGSRLLAGNVVWNLLGTAAPMLVAVFCIPVLLRGLGKDRFGILMLAWALVGYAGLFDLGLGRALTKLVAEKLGTGARDEILGLFWTSMVLLFGLGLVGASVVIVASHWLVFTLLKIPPAMQTEAFYAFLVLGLSVPGVIVTSGLRGFLEAHQRFRLINTLRIPMGVFTFVGPLLVLPFSRSLFYVVAVLVLGRYLAGIAHLVFCFNVMPSLRKNLAICRSGIASLVRLGSWMTVSNVVGPLMLYSDRFLIGSLISVTAVAYYATPYEVITKLLLVPTAIVAVMFPAFSATFAQDRERTGVIFARSLKAIMSVVFPTVLVIVLFSNQALRLWLGPDFAAHSTRVLQFLAAGVFINSLTQLPFALIQSVGRPDLAAKLHLVELPTYLLALSWLVIRHGIEGAAIAWTIRVTLDCIIMFVLARRVVASNVLISGRIIALLIVSLAILGLACVPQTIMFKALFLVVSAPLCALAAWFRLFSAEERAQLQATLSVSRVLNG